MIRTRLCLLALFLLGVLDRDTFGQLADFDKDILNVAEKIAVQIKQAERKKVAVLDFSDLQGNTTEFGRFVAEELSVSLVERRNGFAIMDRANLNRILAELKLTADGLVDPENAKKLGQFSGVDAIIIGSVTQLQDEIAITVKVIATDTAEIVGAAKARVVKSKEAEQLLGSTIGGNSSPKASKSSTQPAAISKRFGSLNIVYESMRALDNRKVLLNFVFQNTSDRTPIAVAFYCESSFSSDAELRSLLLGSDGLQLSATSGSLSGIRGIRARPSNLTEISPGDEIRVSVQFESRQNFTALPPSFRLQSEIVMDPNYSASSYPANFQSSVDALPGNCRVHNLVLDLPTR